MSTLPVALLAAVGCGIFAARLGRTADESGATTLVRGGLGTVAAIVLVEQLLGLAGQLAAAPIALALVGSCAALAVAARRLRPDEPRRAPAWSPLELGLAAALAVALATRGWDALHRTTFLYDALSYHLHAPATWLHDRRLSLVPAVFGDPAPAYAPANLELVFALLLGDARSGALAQAGQAPLAALGCAAVAAAVREAGATRAASLAAALAFLLVPEIWQQSTSAMTDVGAAAFFLAALPFTVRLARRSGASLARDAAAFGLAAGLCAGAKVVGAVFVLPLVGVAVALCARARAPRAVAALAVAFAATGAFFYARNLALAGNPLYPLALKLGGATIAPGAYDSAVLRTSVYHVARGDLAALGALLLEPGLAFALGGGLALALCARGAPAWALLAAALVALFWLAIPYQESRFLFPVWGVVAIAMAAGTRDRAGPLRWAPLALGVVGSVVEQPTLERAATLGLGAAVALAAGARRWTSPVSLRALAVAALLLAPACASLPAREPAYALGDDLDEAWAWLRANVHDARAWRTPGTTSPSRSRARASPTTSATSTSRAGQGTSSTTSRAARPRRASGRSPPLTGPARATTRGSPTCAPADATSSSSRRSTRAYAPPSPPTATASPSSGPGPTRTPPSSRCASRRPRRASTACGRDAQVRPRGRRVGLLGAACCFSSSRGAASSRWTRPISSTTCASARSSSRRTRCRARTCSRSPRPTRPIRTSPGSSRSSSRSPTAPRASPARSSSRRRSSSRPSRCSYRVALRRGAHPAAAAAALALAAWAAEPRFVERPHLVTFLGLALTLLALERAEQGTGVRRWAMALLVPCGLVWANANSCFFLAPALLLLYAGGALLDGRRADARRAALVAAVLAPLVLATPSGADALRYIANHFRMPSVRPLQEYRAASWPLDGPFFFLAAARCLASACAPGRGPGGTCCRRWPSRVLGARRIRFVAELALVAGPIVAVAATRLMTALASSVERPATSAASAAVGAGLVVLALAPRLGAAGRGDAVLELGVEADLLPTEALRFVDAHRLRGRMYNDLEVGSYLAWEGWPRFPVFQDPRINGYPEAMHAVLRRADLTRAEWQAFLDGFGVTTALISYPTVNPRSALFAPDLWALVYRADDGLVFVRRDLGREDLAALISAREEPVTFARDADGTISERVLEARPAGSPVPDGVWWGRVADADVGRGDDARARSFYARALADPSAPRLGPDGRDAWAVGLGDLELRRGEREAAVAAYARSGDVVARVKRGLALLALRRPAAALEELGGGAASAESNDPDARLGEGLALAALGRRDEARAALEAFVSRAPDHVGAARARAEARPKLR